MTHYTWPSAMKAKRSPLNVGRSTERNKRKGERSKENGAYRAELHREKASSRNAGTQEKIDQISRRGGT